MRTWETENWTLRYLTVKLNYDQLKMEWWLPRKNKKTWDSTTRICWTATMIWSPSATPSTSIAMCFRIKIRILTLSLSDSCKQMNKSELPWIEETEFWVLENKQSSRLANRHTMLLPELLPWEEDIDRQNYLSIYELFLILNKHNSISLRPESVSLFVTNDSSLTTILFLTWPQNINFN